MRKGSGPEAVAASRDAAARALSGAAAPSLASAARTAGNCFDKAHPAFSAFRFFDNRTARARAAPRANRP